MIQRHAKILLNFSCSAAVVIFVWSVTRKSKLQSVQSVFDLTFKHPRAHSKPQRTHYIHGLETGVLFSVPSLPAFGWMQLKMSEKQLLCNIRGGLQLSWHRSGGGDYNNAADVGKDRLQCIWHSRNYRKCVYSIGWKMNLICCSRGGQ